MQLHMFPDRPEPCERLVMDMVRKLHGANANLLAIDIGCGDGRITRAIQPFIGPKSLVVGVDSDEAHLRLAARISQRVGSVAKFVLADAIDLPFGDCMFDVVLCHYMLHEVKPAERAVAELVRITRKGGFISLVDRDLGGEVIDSTDESTTDRLLTVRQDIVANPWAGRQLLRLLCTAGIENTRIVVLPRVCRTLAEWAPSYARGFIDSARRAKFATREECDNWLKSQQFASKKRHFFAIQQVFVALATKGS
jgi:ubiquinone/menaquinone biosynthesis C-methylase UbiE